MNKKYAIFDMDGTLIDSMQFWKRLAGEYLNSRGVTSLPADLGARIAAMTMTESAAFFLREFHLSGTPASAAAEMNAIMDRHYRCDVPLKPGAAEYLRGLQREGVRMCVASATDGSLMEDCLRRLHVRDCFEFLLSCEEVNAGKTSPAVYLEAARRLNAAPADIAVYEDALYAARTAGEAGFYVVGVYDESGKKNWETLAALADETIQDFRHYVGKIDRTQMCHALWTGDTETAQTLISGLLLKTISYYDYQESYYHAFLAGLFAGDEYEVESNNEYGTGRPDVVVKDDENQRALVIEVKYAKTADEIPAKFREAQKQFADRRYLAGISEEYTVKIGYCIVFHGKKCRIEKAAQSISL